MGFAGGPLPCPFTNCRIPAGTGTVVIEVEPSDAPAEPSNDSGDTSQAANAAPAPSAAPAADSVDALLALLGTPDTERPPQGPEAAPPVATCIDEPPAPMRLQKFETFPAKLSLLPVN